MEKSNWDYITQIDFDPDDFDSDHEQTMKQYQKLKYKKAILPMIEKLEKEIKTSKNEKHIKKKKNSRKFLDDLLREKLNGRNLRIRYENNEVYPKNILPPNIVFIQFAEPHIWITDLSDSDEEWYRLRDIIPDFANESFLTYEMGCWLASISSAINCCEYILKYELFRTLKENNKTLLQIVIKDRSLTLGKLINDKKHNYLKMLNIEFFQYMLNYLNLVRISIYHFNSETAKKVNQTGQIEIERSAPITDDMVMPIISFNVYNIMIELIDHFYNKEKALKYYKESIADWKKR